MGAWRIRSSEGPEFGGYLALPAAPRKVPAVVLACAIHGVDRDLRAIADAIAARGYIAAAPDLFWRTLPGALPRGDPRCAERAQPRAERIRIGEQDLLDAREALHREPRFNGRALVMGFCYGGPYAILGPRRLGFDAGIACHGSAMLDVAHEALDLHAPVSVMWGDRDPMAPHPVRRAYLETQRRDRNVAVHLFRGVGHGYMMRSSPAFDAEAYAFSLRRALAMLRRLALSVRCVPAAGTP